MSAIHAGAAAALAQLKWWLTRHPARHHLTIYARAYAALLLCASRAKCGRYINEGCTQVNQLHQSEVKRALFRRVFAAQSAKPAFRIHNKVVACHHVYIVLMKLQAL